MLLSVDCGQSAQNEADELAGKIGAAGYLGDNEVLELDDEFETIGTVHRIPANLGVVAFEIA